MFSAFTTRASGNARWIRSPRLSSLHTDSVGGIPWLKSSALATSISTLPARFSAPAASSASSDAPPAVALTTTSPNSAASANEPSLAPSPASAAQATAFSLPACREPIFTSCPSSTSLPAIACPTVPVPSTPNLIAPAPYNRRRAAGSGRVSPNARRVAAAPWRIRSSQRSCFRWRWR